MGSATPAGADGVRCAGGSEDTAADGTSDASAAAIGITATRAVRAISPARMPSPPVSPGVTASSALLGATRSSTDASARSVPSSRLLTHRIAPGPAMRRQSDQAMPNQSVAISRPTPWTHRNTTMRTPRDSRFMGTRATNRHDVERKQRAARCLCDLRRHATTTLSHKGDMRRHMKMTSIRR